MTADAASLVHMAYGEMKAREDAMMMWATIVSRIVLFANCAIAWKSMVSVLHLRIESHSTCVRPSPYELDVHYFASDYTTNGAEFPLFDVCAGCIVPHARLKTARCFVPMKLSA